MNEDRKAAAVKAGFTEEDAQKLMEFTDIICGLTVKNYLLGLIESKKEASGLSNAAYKDLKRKIKLISNKRHVGFQTAVIKDNYNVEYTLKFIPAIVSHDHTQELAVPPMQSQDTCIKGIFQSWDRLIIMLREYYSGIIKINDLDKDLANFLPDIDVNSLTLRQTDRHLYLDCGYTQHIAVVLYYIDENGNPAKIDS